MKEFFTKLQELPRIAGIIIAGLTLFTLFVYYPVGMIVVNNIDDSPEQKTDAFEVAEGSHAVSMAITLMDREVNQHQWVASDPFFYPGALLVRMPAFQRGIKDSVARFTIELYDHIGRTRGSSQADADLLKANGLLNYSPYVWMFDFSTSWLPTTSSPTQYRSGLEALRSYNSRLGQHRATFDRRADNLIELLNRMGSDLGSASATIASQIETGGTFAFRTNGDLYYNTKGRMYGDYMLMLALKTDFADVLKEKQLEPVWDQALQTLADGMKLRNFLVINAAPDNQLLPNHLATQGFFVMRARLQMYEITNILLK